VVEPEFKNIWQINFYAAYASITLNEEHFKKKYFFDGGFRYHLNPPPLPKYFFATKTQRH
jgi:hypothetical protein